MRLDFDENGEVDFEDIRNSLKQLVTFLKEFEYLQATTNIKNSLYAQAAAMVIGQPE